MAKNQRCEKHLFSLHQVNVSVTFLTTKREMVLETLIYSPLNQPTRLAARECFIEFSRLDIFRLHCKINFVEYLKTELSLKCYIWSMALYGAETHCIEGWLCPRAGLDECGKPRPHGDSIPGPSSP